MLSSLETMSQSIWLYQTSQVSDIDSNHLLRIKDLGIQCRFQLNNQRLQMQSSLL